MCIFHIDEGSTVQNSTTISQFWDFMKNLIKTASFHQNWFSFSVPENFVFVNHDNKKENTQNAKQ